MRAVPISVPGAVIAANCEDALTEDVIYQVAVHEIGHALVGLFTKHRKLIKITINLFSPILDFQWVLKLTLQYVSCYNQFSLNFICTSNM